MSYCRLYYHLVWHTQDNQPVITEEVEYRIHGAIKNKMRALGGTVYEVNGTEDHVHAVGTIPPTISVARFVGEVKGASAFHINHVPNGRIRLDWDRGYGAVSFRRDNLEQVIEYVRNQKQHHKEGKLWPSLETCDEDDSRGGTRVNDEEAEYAALPWG